MDFSGFFRTAFDGGFSQFNLIEQADERTFVFLHSRLVDRLLVNGASLPALPDDPLPFVGQRPHRCVVAATFVALLPIVGRCPAAVQDRFLGVFVETLLEKLRAKVASMDRSEERRVGRECRYRLATYQTRTE